MRAARRALVVGGGPGGLAAAVALRRAGCQVTVFERTREPRTAGSGLTLWPNASRALAAIGRLPALHAVSRPLERIVMANWRGRSIFEDALAPVDGDGRYPATGLLRRDLVDLLADPVGDAIVAGAQLVGVEQTAREVIARFADGTDAVGDLLVGADGLHSVVRTHAAVPTPLIYGGYSVWRGIAALADAPPVGTTWMGPAKQFGCFPLTGGRAYWFASAATAAGGRDGPDGPVAFLEAAFSAWPDPIPRVLRSTKPNDIVRTDVFDRDPLPRWSLGRMTLLGDAAHPAQPTLGQGACQAIEDGVTLGQCVSEADDPAEALAEYERRRLARANGLVREARRIGAVGLWRHALACSMRDALMSAMPARLRRRQLASLFAFDAASAEIGNCGEADGAPARIESPARSEP